MFELITISDALKRSYASEGILIDVRSEEAYRKGHLPMAVHVSLEDILEGRYRPEGKKLVFLYCDTGLHSMLAARKLDEEGVQAYTVSGGLRLYRGYLEKEKNDLWTMVLH